MAAEIFAGLGAIKTAFDLAKGLQDIHDAAARDRIVIELQKEILSAQAEQAALVQRVRELEAKLASFEKWESEKDRYQLKDFGGNTFAHEMKADKARGEPPYRICPNCYEKGNKSILQFRTRTAFGQDRYHCPSCNTDFEFGHRTTPPSGRASWGNR